MMVIVLNHNRRQTQNRTRYIRRTSTYTLQIVFFGNESVMTPKSAVVSHSVASIAITPFAEQRNRTLPQEAAFSLFTPPSLRTGTQLTDKRYKTVNNPQSEQWISTLCCCWTCLRSASLSFQSRRSLSFFRATNQRRDHQKGVTFSLRRVAAQRLLLPCRIVSND